MILSVTFILILVTVLVSVPVFNNHDSMSKLLFNPYVVKVRGEWYRFISHAFIHANWTHLLVNMFVLYIFGSGVEAFIIQQFGQPGKLYFLLLYVGGILFASLPSYRKHIANPGYNALGASGAVSAVLFAHILLKPTDLLYLYFAIPLPSFVFGIGYLWYEAYMDKRAGDNIAHDAHFWGALFGVIFMIAVDVNHLTNFVYQVSNWITNLF